MRINDIAEFQKHKKLVKNKIKGTSWTKAVPSSNYNKIIKNRKLIIATPTKTSYIETSK